MNVRRVCVIGHRGMLGHVVARHLGERGFQVSTSDVRFDITDVRALHELVDGDYDAFVNCAARLQANAPDAYFVNALLPQLLAARAFPRLVVHASTDGVFSGTGHAPYSASAVPDATDAYGVSKRLGELCVPVGNVVLFRCSIVGFDALGRRGLLEWVRSQSGGVNGFVNHTWNGITTLEWARLCELALSGELACGLHQPACATAVSKFELALALVEAAGWDLTVRPIEAPTAVDRRLVPTIACAPIAEQLAELVRWYRAAHPGSLPS